MSTATEVNPRLLALTAGGRQRLARPDPPLAGRGRRARRGWSREESLRGVTSNPSIFEKAILGSDDYDEDLKALAEQDLDAQAIYERLAIRDVQLAADVLADVHRESGGRDGFVSLEVAPDLAHDTEGTLEAARTYWKARRPAERDDQDPRHARGRAGDRAGDLRGDQRQRHAAVRGRGVRGRWPRPTSAGSSAARRRASRSTSTRSRRSSSRASTRRSTSSSRRSGASDLAGHRGASPTRARLPALQGDLRRAALGGAAPTPAPPCSGRCGPRPASRTRTTPTRSTSTSSSAPHTVNTMPLATLLAVADHGEVDRSDGRARSRRRRSTALAEAGIDMAQVTDELLVDGVKQFEDAMSRLLAGIDERRAAVVTGQPPTIAGRLAGRARGRRSPRASSRRSPRTSPSASGGATRRCGAGPASRRSRTASAG